MMAPSAYENATFDATYHIQIEIKHDKTKEENSSRMKQCINQFHVSGVVKRILRGDGLLEIENEISLTIGIAPTSAEISASDLYYTNLDGIIVSTFMEVFLNGKPPDLKVPASQIRVIENLTQNPTIHGPKNRSPLIPEELRIQMLESSLKAKLAIERMRNDAESKGQEQLKWDRETFIWIKDSQTKPTQTTSPPRRWWQFWR
jgi:hypothetical protein